MFQQNAESEIDADAIVTEDDYDLLEDEKEDKFFGRYLNLDNFKKVWFWFAVIIL